MKFRKKPVVIEAWLIPPVGHASLDAPPTWLVSAIVNGTVQALQSGGVLIETLEGTHRGDVGDWIIQGVKGELYPCKPDIFAATYDEIPEPPLPQMIAQRAEQLRNEQLETGPG